MMMKNPNQRGFFYFVWWGRSGGSGVHGGATWWERTGQGNRERRGVGWGSQSYNSHKVPPVLS